MTAINHLNDAVKVLVDIFKNQEPSNISRSFNSFQAGRMQNPSNSFGAFGDGMFIFYMILIGTIIIISTVGNIIVFAAVLKSKNIIHLPTFYLILNLAFADLFLATVVMPMSIMIILSYRDVLKFDTSLCLVWQSLLFFFISLSILTLSAISIERCLAVTSTYIVHRRFRSRWIIIIIIVIWCLSLGLAVKPIVDLIQLNAKPVINSYPNGISTSGSTQSTGLLLEVIQQNISIYPTARLDPNPTLTTSRSLCTYYNPYHNLPYLAYVLLVVYLVSPFIVMIGSNARIYHAARQHFKMRREMLRMYTTTIAIPSNPQRGRESKRFLRELRAAKTLGVVVGIAILCYTPFTVFTFLLQICPKACLKTRPTLQWLGIVLTYINSACNPIIYGWSSREFRFAFKYLFKMIDHHGRRNSYDSSSVCVQLSSYHQANQIPLSVTPVTAGDSRRGSQTSLTFTRSSLTVNYSNCQSPNISERAQISENVNNASHNGKTTIKE